MMHVLSLVNDPLAGVSSKAKAPDVKFQSVWVLVGFTFWFGFYLGAVIMHTVTK